MTGIEKLQFEYEISKSVIIHRVDVIVRQRDIFQIGEAKSTDYNLRQFVSIQLIAPDSRALISFRERMSFFKPTKSRKKSLKSLVIQSSFKNSISSLFNPRKARNPLGTLQPIVVQVLSFG